MSKREMRVACLKKRNEFSENEIRNKSSLIHEKLFTNEFFLKSPMIFTYISFGSEVLTTPVIETALNAGKVVAVPVIEPRERRMFFVKIDGETQFIKNRFGVQEPFWSKADILNGSKEAVNIVPGVAFDKNKYRIGYGAGYYDRYLNNNQFLKTIGLCFSWQIVESCEPENHDICMDMIITEEDIYV